jgi:hypothetical protein
MKKQSLALTAGVALAIAGLAPTVASATGVCYAFVPVNYLETSEDGGPPLVLRYIATSVGAINTDTEAKTLGHLKQTAYSLVGKSTVLFDDRCATMAPADCNEVTNNLEQIRLMTTIDGTIITGKVLLGTNPADPPGAHMGINVHFLRRIPGIYGFAVGPLTLECSSPQPSTAPATWLCNVRAEIDINVDTVAQYFPIFEQYAFNAPVVLEKLPANTAKACSVFQDGRPDVPDPI